MSLRILKSLLVSLKIKFMFSSASFPVFAVFKDDLTTRKRSKLSSYSQIITNILRKVFFSIYDELISTKGFLKFCKLKLISNLILGQIGVSVKY